MPFILYTWQEILMTLPRFTGSQEKNTALVQLLVVVGGWEKNDINAILNSVEVKVEHLARIQVWYILWVPPRCSTPHKVPIYDLSLCQIMVSCLYSTIVTWKYLWICVFRKEDWWLLNIIKILWCTAQYFHILPFLFYGSKLQGVD